jgi:phosphatidylinositol dimannoside acyltransferase
VTALSGGVTTDDPVMRRAVAPATGLRRSTVDWWIPPLVWLVRRQPWLIRPLRPMILAGGWRYSSQLRANMMHNARRLLGESSTLRQRRTLAKATFACFFDSIIDVVAAAARSDEYFADRLAEVRGQDGYRRARSLRRGAILVTAHLGAFEIGMFALRRHEPKVHVIFRRDSLKAFDDVRRQLRERFQVAEAPVDDGLPVWMGLRDALERDEVVLMQGDRALPGQRGIPVPFMGGHLLMPTGPVKLALATGAPIVPIFAPRDPDGRVRIHLHDPIPIESGDGSVGEIERVLRRLAAAMESEIRAHPQQWLVVHRAWCEDAEESASMESRE